MAFPAWAPYAAFAAMYFIATSKARSIESPADTAGCLPKASKAVATVLLRAPQSGRPLMIQTLKSQGETNTADALSSDAPRAELEEAIAKDLIVASPERLYSLSDTMGTMGDVEHSTYASDCLFALAAEKEAGVRP